MRNLIPKFERIVKVSGIKGAVSLKAISRQKIQCLNSKYRKKSKSTDILSFTHNDDIFNIAGEIFISPIVVYKYCYRKKISIENRFRKLFVHGISHLLGFDHVSDIDYRKVY